MNYEADDILNQPYGFEKILTSLNFFEKIPTHVRPFWRAFSLPKAPMRAWIVGTHPQFFCYYTPFYLFLSPLFLLFSYLDPILKIKKFIFPLFFHVFFSSFSLLYFFIFYLLIFYSIFAFRALIFFFPNPMLILNF